MKIFSFHMFTCLTRAPLLLTKSKLFLFLILMYNTIALVELAEYSLFFKGVIGVLDFVFSGELIEKYFLSELAMKHSSLETASNYGN